MPPTDASTEAETTSDPNAGRSGAPTDAADRPSAAITAEAVPAAGPEADGGTCTPAGAGSALSADHQLCIDHPAGSAPDAGPGHGTGPLPAWRATSGTGSASDAAIGSDKASGLVQDSEDTLDLRLPDDFLVFPAEEVEKLHGGLGEGGGAATHRTYDDLLDHLAEWGPTTTPAGVLHLVPVRLERDLALISRWMNDPAVAVFWRLAGPPSVTEAHLRRQLDGDGRSIPCLGLLDGTPMSYWEVYRADLDPLARRYPARPHDTGVHLLIGAVADRGRGLGSSLLRAVADLVLEKRPSCARVIAEPDLRNTPSISALLSAGFRFSAEVDLPDKRAALMVRDRALRDLL